MELSRYRNHLALVLEDSGGAVLERLLGRPFGIAEFLRIARAANSVSNPIVHLAGQMQGLPRYVRVSHASFRTLATGGGAPARFQSTFRCGSTVARGPRAGRSFPSSPPRAHPPARPRVRCPCRT